MQQRFWSEKQNVEVNKITLSANNGKRIKFLDSIDTYVYGASKDLVCKKEEIECINIIKNDD